MSDVIATVSCDEPRGRVSRHIRLCELTSEKIRYIHSKLARFDTIFLGDNDRSLEATARNFFYQNRDGSIEPCGILWEVDDVGIILVDDIRPGYECRFHFSFWDGRLRGRIPIIRAILQHLFKDYQFHRIYTEVPLYSSKHLKFVRDSGFKHEGRKRKSVRYRGEWHDSLVLSILEGEINEAQQDDSNADQHRDTVLA